MRLRLTAGKFRLAQLGSDSGKRVSSGPKRVWRARTAGQRLGVDVHGIWSIRRLRPFPFYRGYSADFFDGKHFVMKGGSARTAACMLRPTFRNWFQSHYQYAYAGFRCVNTSEE